MRRLWTHHPHVIGVLMILTTLAIVAATHWLVFGVYLPWLAGR